MKANISRRSFLCSAVAVAGAAIAPTVPSAAKAARPRLAFVVGTDGESDWQFLRAPDLETAKLWWSEDKFGDCECESLGPDAETGEALNPGVCDRCEHGAPSGRREPGFDALEGEPTSADWLRIDFGAICDRCGEECDNNDAKIVADKAVCEYCMTLADWQAVDPERAEEIRASYGGQTEISGYVR